MTPERSNAEFKSANSHQLFAIVITVLLGMPLAMGWLSQIAA